MSCEPGMSKLEIVSRRVPPFSRERLWDAFANPDHLARWWGPHGFTNTIDEFDLREGGTWRFTMHGPNGAHYPNEKKFLEVKPLSRVVFEHIGPMHRFLMTMIYTDLGKSSELNWQMVFDSPTDPANLKKFIEGANEENFDRLEEYLKNLQ